MTVIDDLLANNAGGVITDEVETGRLREVS